MAWLAAGEDLCSHLMTIFQPCILELMLMKAALALLFYVNAAVAAACQAAEG